MVLEEMPAVIPERQRQFMRGMQEEGADRSGYTGASQTADHAGEPEGPGDHAEPCEPDGAV